MQSATSAGPVALGYLSVEVSRNEALAKQFDAVYFRFCAASAVVACRLSPECASKIFAASHGVVLVLSMFFSMMQPTTGSADLGKLMPPSLRCLPKGSLDLVHQPGPSLFAWSNKETLCRLHTST